MAGSSWAWACGRHSAGCSSTCGLVVEYVVAIDVTRVRFPADAFLAPTLACWPCPRAPDKRALMTQDTKHSLEHDATVPPSLRDTGEYDCAQPSEARLLPVEVSAVHQKWVPEGNKPRGTDSNECHNLTADAAQAPQLCTGHRQWGRVVLGTGSRRQSAGAWVRTPQLSLFWWCCSGWMRGAGSFRNFAAHLALMPCCAPLSTSRPPRRQVGIWLPHASTGCLVPVPSVARLRSARTQHLPRALCLHA